MTKTVNCECTECGEMFTYVKTGRGPDRQVCSDGCKKLRALRYPTRPRKKLGKRRVRTACVVCKKVFSYEKESGRLRNTCSPECTTIRHREHGRTHSRKTARTKRYSGTCVVCGKYFKSSNKTTITCGRSCGKRLSDKTRSINASNRRFERTGRHDDSDLIHRRAKAEWKRQGDVIDREQLFERDGWRCYICGDSTPKELMGSHHPKAPEIDHVVPFAAGGQHTWVNTACACRACNSAKKHSLTDTAVMFMTLGLF